MTYSGQKKTTGQLGVCVKNLISWNAGGGGGEFWRHYKNDAKTAKKIGQQKENLVQTWGKSPVILA